jgi:alpha-beta hydrolase superfamily lysophospholipase
LVSRSRPGLRVSGIRRLEVGIDADGATLAATVSLPNDVPAPAVVALHGAAEGTRDGQLYTHLHRALPGAGFAVATFDRRGDGASTGEPSRGHFARQAADALAVVEYVGALDGVDPDRIGLWGHSQGAWVAPLAAGGNDAVQFLVLVASCGVRPGEQMRFAATTQVRAAVDERAAKAAANLWTLVLQWLDGAPREPVESAIESARRLSWWPLVHLDGELPADDQREALRQELLFEPAPVFAATDVPTLLVYGPEDDWIPVRSSIDTWRRARRSGIELALVPGAKHTPVVDGKIAPLYNHALLAWLLRTVS